MRTPFSFDEWLNNEEPLLALETDGWVQISAVPPDEGKLKECLSRIGTLVPQYGGELFWDVKPVYTDEPTSVGNAAVDLHTELVEFSDPPDYVALLCLVASTGGGCLRLLDTRGILDELTPEEITQLSEEKILFSSEPSLSRDHGTKTLNAPVLSSQGGRLVLRYDPVFFTDETPPSIRDLQKKIVSSENHELRFTQQPGSLVIWDNGRILHGRTAFQDKRRHLWRCCIRKAT